MIKLEKDLKQYDLRKAKEKKKKKTFSTDFYLGWCLV